MRSLVLVALVGCGSASGDLVESSPDARADTGAVEDAAVDVGDVAVDAADVAPDGPCRSVAAWSASAPFADASHGSHPLPSFARGGFYYVHTQSGGGGDRVLRAARIEGDKLSAWFVASADHGGGPHGFTAIVADGEAYHFRNGHIARYPFDSTTGAMTGDVVLVEKSVDAAFGGNKYVWDSAVYAASIKRVLHLGGFSFTGYTYKPDVYGAATPMPPAFTATGKRHPADRPGKSAVLARGTDALVFTGEGSGDRLWRARLGADGALDAWVVLGNLPAGTGNQRGDLFVVGRTLFAVRGAAVFAADVRDDGALSAWNAMPSLPSEQIDVTWGEGHLEGAAWGATADAVFVTGAKSVFGGRLVPRACAP